MKIDEIIYSLKNLMKRKMRSWLTVLSILIGITAIFALVSFGLGIQNYVNVLADEMGRNKIFIQPKGVGVPGLDESFLVTKEEVDFVSKIKGIGEISGMYIKTADIKHKKQLRYGFIMGMDPKKIKFLNEAFTVEIIKGRDLKVGETDKVVLGYNYQLDETIFKKGLKIGDKVEVNGNEFEIVGFYEEVGNPGDDSNIYVTLKGFEILYPGLTERFGYVILTSEKGVDPSALADKIEDKLRKFKDQDKGKEDFYVQTFDDLLETFGSVLVIINGVLVLIALISLVVASVNIMNTMYTAVLERTKEIGVMKAIGARRSNILFIFIFESGFLGMVGGVIGVVLGYIIAKLGGMFAASAGYSSLQPIFPWYLTLGCVLFAFFIGAIAGILPAVQAAKLQPVDALRYE